MTPDLPPPAVSVLIPVRGAPEPLAACLDAIFAGELPAGGLEVLVAGPPPAEALRAVLRRWEGRLPSGCRLLWLDNPSGSTPVGLNRALAAARGPVVLRLDAHALPAPDYVTACRRALAETGAGCVGGPLRGWGTTAWGRAVALAWTQALGAGDAAFRRTGEGGGPRAVDTVYLGAWPRDLLLALGGWDERLPRNQDYELALRLRRAGHRVVLDPRIRSRTLTRGSPIALIRQYWGYGQGRAATLALHPGSLRWRQALPALWTAYLLVAAGAAAYLSAAAEAAARPAFTPAWRLLPALPAAAYLALLLGSPLRVAQERDAPARDLALLPAVYLCMHLPWGLGFWWGALTRWGRLGPASSPGPTAAPKVGGR